MCHTPSSGPDDEPTEDFIITPQQYISKHLGGLTLTEWQKRVIDRIFTDYNESPEKFERERLNKWTSDHIHDDDGTVEGCPGCFPGPAEEVKRRLAKGVGIYNAMIHRTVDGSDPLVEEPGP